MLRIKNSIEPQSLKVNVGDFLIVDLGGSANLYYRIIKSTSDKYLLIDVINGYGVFTEFSSLKELIEELTKAYTSIQVVPSNLAQLNFQELRGSF